MDEKGLKSSITEKGKEGKSKNDYVVQISGESFGNTVETKEKQWQKVLKRLEWT